ncbi:polyprenyl synthetase family protein [Nonomuraea sp. NPDC004354]
MAEYALPAEILARCRELLEPAMRAAVADLHPWGERMAAFSLGWSDIDGTPIRGDAGKGLRPALAMLCAQAAGGTLETAVPGAVAVELVHAFSLVHDDIIDSDERRRHKPAVWKAYGVGPAILAGDALLALAIRAVATGPHAAATTEWLSAALVRLVHGQTHDMAFEERPWTGQDAVSVAEYTGMAADKTGSLLACAAALGVTLAGAPEPMARRMHDMGLELGLAFQMVDDVLGIWGDPAHTGKPVFGDLRRRKKTLPVLAALASDSTAGRELSALLACGADDEDTIRLAADLIDAAGGRTTTLTMAADHASRALDILDRAFPSATELRALCTSLLDRTH